MKDLIVTILIVIAIFLVSLISLNSWNKSQLKKSCNVFAEESNRETKYVEYTFWRYDCLTPQENEIWTSVFNLRGK